MKKTKLERLQGKLFESLSTEQVQMTAGGGTYVLDYSYNETGIYDAQGLPDALFK